MNKQILLGVTAIAVMSLSACAGDSSPMSTGERISERGGQISGYGDEWSTGRHNLEQGQNMIEKGSKDAAKGEVELAKARENVAKAEARIRAALEVRTNGEQLVSDGTAKMQRAEADYSAVRSGPSANPNPQN